MRPLPSLPRSVSEAPGCAATTVAGEPDSRSPERRVDDGADVGGELDALVRELAEVHAADRPFKHGEMLDPGALSRSDDPLVAEGWQALGRLVATAQREGAVRADVGLADLVVLVTSVPDDPERRRAYVAVVLDGLRPPRR